MTDPTPMDPQWVEIPPVPDKTKESGIGTIVVALVDALDELRARNEVLETRVAALEGPTP